MGRAVSCLTLEVVQLKRVNVLARVICWLRGDPESLSIVRKFKKLLEVQNITITVPDDLKRTSCDAVVCCGCGFIEEICHEDPWISLFTAIAPKGGFHALRIGVDPGFYCSMAAYADELLVWLERDDCRILAGRVYWLISKIPASKHVVNIGDGPGWEAIGVELSRAGVSFRVVSEARTSSAPVYSRLRELVRDEDLLAAMTIALSF